MEALDRHLDVHLREAGEQLLAGALVASEDERRVLLGKAAQRRGRLVLVALRLRRDGEAHHRLGEVDRRQVDGALRIEQEIAGVRLLQLGDGADVALAELGRRGVLLALEHSSWPRRSFECERTFATVESALSAP